MFTSAGEAAPERHRSHERDHRDREPCHHRSHRHRSAPVARFHRETQAADTGGRHTHALCGAHDLREPRPRPALHLAAWRGAPRREPHDGPEHEDEHDRPQSEDRPIDVEPAGDLDRAHLAQRHQRRRDDREEHREYAARQHGHDRPERHGTASKPPASRPSHGARAVRRVRCGAGGSGPDRRTRDTRVPRSRRRG